MSHFLPTPALSLPTSYNRATHPFRWVLINSTSHWAQYRILQASDFQNHRTTKTPRNCMIWGSNHSSDTILQVGLLQQEPRFEPAENSLAFLPTYFPSLYLSELVLPLFRAKCTVLNDFYIPPLWATCPPRLTCFAQGVVVSCIAVKIPSGQLNVWAEAIDPWIKRCICSESNFSPVFSWAYALYNLFPYLTTEAGLWGVRWCNGKEVGEGEGEGGHFALSELGSRGFCQRPRQN